MRFLSNLSLERKVPLLTALGILTLLAVSAFLGVQAVADSRGRALEERLLMARMAAGHVDQTLEQGLAMLEKTASLPAFDLKDGDQGPESTVLTNSFSQFGLFSNLFMLDRDGNVVWAQPPTDQIQIGANLLEQPSINQTFAAKQAFISGVQCALVANERMVCLMAPIRNEQGEVTGLLGAAIDLSHPGIGGSLSNLRLGETGYAEIVGASGAVLVSTKSGPLPDETAHGDRFASLIEEHRAVVSTCHSCHESGAGLQRQSDILAFAPLSVAPWAVAISQSEGEAFAPATNLTYQVIVLSALSLLVASVFSWITTRSVTRPVRSLIVAAQRIAGGDLSQPLRPRAGNEVGQLTTAFEIMRGRLKSSLEELDKRNKEIEDWNRELANRVRQKTLENSLLLKEASQAAALRDADRLKSEFISTVSHDLRTPLNHIKGFASTLLQEDVEWDAGAQKDFLETINREADKLTNLVDNVLEMSRIEAGILQSAGPECSDPAEAVAAALERIKSLLQDREVELSLPEHLPMVGIGPGDLERILINLVENAVKYSSDSVPIGVEARHRGNLVELTVWDRGIGIDKENLAKIFAKFFRVQNGVRGTGLGLTICRNIVERHGGRIWVDSAPGEGARFSFTVPIDDGS